MSRFVRLASLAVFFVTISSAQTVEQRLEKHARLAKTAEASQNFTVAAKEYEAMAALLPSSAQIRTNLGIDLYLDRQFERAADQLREATRLDANLFSAHLFTGLSLFRLSAPDAAERALLAAVRLNSRDLLAHLWLGYVHMAQQRYVDAGEQFRTVLAADPNHVDALYSLGQVQLELARIETEQLLKVAPDGGRVWQLAADQCRLRGDLRSALDLYRGAYARRPDIPEVRSALEDLQASFETLQASRPPVPGEDKSFALATEYGRLARQAFEQLGRVAPDSYRTHEAAADAFALAGRSAEAMAEYRAVLRAKPDLPGIHRAVGTLFLREGKAAEAARCFQAELALDPRSATANVDLARALLTLGQGAQAEHLLRQALLLDRPPASANKLLAKRYLERQDPSAAVPLFEKYVRLYPGDASAHFLLARAYRLSANSSASNREFALFRKLSLDAKSRRVAETAIRMLRTYTEPTEQAAAATPPL